jgi:hypothetical protein
MRSYRKVPRGSHPLYNEGFNKENDPRLANGGRAAFLQDLTRSRLSEKEFYEKVKDWLDNSVERFGSMVASFLDIIQERQFSAYQLFKILMNFKMKPKLRSVFFEDEKGFCSSFWRVMDSQKDGVKIEGLKLLGFLTTDYLQNISHHMQLSCISHLQKLASIQIKNLNVIRLSLNCLGNILTHSNYKIAFEINDLFHNLLDILKHLESNEKLDDQCTVRLLAALFRVMNCLYTDLKNFSPSICEFLTSQLIKYLYLGTQFFILPTPSFNSPNNSSSDSLLYTSSSDLTESCESEEKRKEEEICSKVRNYCATCLAGVLKQDSKLVSQHISTLLPCKILSQETLKILESIREPLVLSHLSSQDKRNRKESHQIQLSNDFNEPNLLYLLLFDENNKVRLSVCKVVSVILESYQNDRLLLALDGEKLEKTKIEPYRLIHHQIYQTFKNLTTVIVIAILIENDENFVSHLLRLAVTLLSHPAFEKVGSHTLKVLVKTILNKFLLRYHYHTIFLNVISCFSALASANVKYKEVETYALSSTFNIIKILIDTIMKNIDIIRENPELRPLKQGRIAEGTILLESILVLSKFPNHYIESILEEIDSIIVILEKIQGFEKKYVSVVYKLVEETIKYINIDKSNVEYLDNDMEIPQPTKTNQLKSKSPFQTKIHTLHVFVEKLLRNTFNHINHENTEYSLNVVYYLDEDDWDKYYTETRKLIISHIFTLNHIPMLKQPLLRLLGKICSFHFFVNMEGFPKIVFNILTMNSNEKNTNIMIKNSWVLANLCANQEACKIFGLETNQELLLMSLNYCFSNKEKIVSNGFRALGYFISNNSDELLCQLPTLKNHKSEQIVKGLKNVYLRSFTTSSVKVCWNVCVSLSNIMKSFKPKFIETFLDQDALGNVALILNAKNNFKAQIHCIEMLALAYERFPYNPCFTVLPKTLISIYFSVDEGEFDFSEIRYLPHLRKDIHNLLIKLLENISFDKNQCLMNEILNTLSHKLLTILNENISKMFQEHKEYFTHKELEENKDNEDSETKKNGIGEDFDEAVIHGESNHKLRVSSQDLQANELGSLREYLIRLKRLSKKIIGFVDSSDDINVPFSVYDSLQQFADLNLENEGGYLEVELYHV